MFVLAEKIITVAKNAKQSAFKYIFFSMTLIVKIVKMHTQVSYRVCSISDLLNSIELRIFNVFFMNRACNF